MKLKERWFDYVQKKNWVAKLVYLDYLKLEVESLRYIERRFNRHNDYYNEIKILLYFFNKSKFWWMKRFDI